MAVGSYDPTTGRPIFPDSGTPDVGVDPTEVGKYAAEVGNRIVGTTTYLNSYAYKREGLGGYDTTLGCPVVYRGGAWKREISLRMFAISRAGMNDGTLYLQTPVEDTAKETKPAFTFSYNSGTGLISVEAGVYLLHVKGHPGGSATGFIQLRAGTQGVLDRGLIASSADPWMAATAVFRTDGTEGFFVEMQKTNGTTSTSQGTLTITKLTTL